LRPVPWGGIPYVLLQLWNVWSRNIHLILFGKTLSFMACLSVLSFVQIFFSRTCHPVWCRPDGYELIWEDVGLLEGDVYPSAWIYYHICDHYMPCSYWSFFLYVYTQICYIDRIGTFSLQCPHLGDLSLSVIVYAGILLARFSKLGR
jgi:hypothetical protein